MKINQNPRHIKCKGPYNERLIPRPFPETNKLDLEIARNR